MGRLLFCSHLKPGNVEPIQSQFAKVYWTLSVHDPFGNEFTHDGPQAESVPGKPDSEEQIFQPRGLVQNGNCVGRILGQSGKCTNYIDVPEKGEVLRQPLKDFYKILEKNTFIKIFRPMRRQSADMDVAFQGLTVVKFIYIGGLSVVKAWIVNDLIS